MMIFLFKVLCMIIIIKFELTKKKLVKIFCPKYCVYDYFNEILPQNWKWIFLPIRLVLRVWLF